MTDINTVTIIGRLVRTPTQEDYGFARGGAAYLKMCIASNESIKREDAYESYANFFDVILWGSQANGIRPYLEKGKQVAVHGRLRQERWQDKQSGKQHSRVGIIASSVQLIGAKSDGNAPATEGGQY